MSIMFALHYVFAIVPLDNATLTSLYCAYNTGQKINNSHPCLILPMPLPWNVASVCLLDIEACRSCCLRPCRESLEPVWIRALGLVQDIHLANLPKRISNANLAIEATYHGQTYWRELYLEWLDGPGLSSEPGCLLA